MIKILNIDFKSFDLFLIAYFLQNLTEFNTAHNRRISMLGIQDDEIRNSSRKRRKKGVSFNEDEEIINPEDVDPSVGRFRNLVHTTVVPTKVILECYQNK